MVELIDGHVSEGRALWGVSVHMQDLLTVHENVHEKLHTGYLNVLTLTVLYMLRTHTQTYTSHFCL